MRKIYGWVFVLVVAAGFAYAQTVVKADQGKPGNQGAWPVTGTLTVAPPAYDGGGPTATVPVTCKSVMPDAGSPWQVTSVGVAATNVPPTSGVTRYYVLVCNSSENSGTPLVKCLGNNTSPVMGVANRGDVLGVADCQQYAILGTNQLKCISDTASTAVTSFECVP